MVTYYNLYYFKVIMIDRDNASCTHTILYDLCWNENLFACT